jgi:hypothetical protein
MGLAIVILFALSAMHGQPVAAPAPIVVAVIVGLSATYSSLLLRRGSPRQLS